MAAYPDKHDLQDKWKLQSVSQHIRDHLFMRVGMPPDWMEKNIKWVKKHFPY